MIEDKPALAMIDQRFLEVGERKGRPVLITATAQYQDRTDDGLPGPGAAPQLDLIDEGIEKAADEHDGRIAATLTSDGLRTWLIYAAKVEPLLRAVSASAKAAGPTGAGRPLGGGTGLLVRSEQDPAWTKFEAALPTAEEGRWNDDMAVIEQLEEHGDDHAVARPIEHLVLLPSKAAQDRFVTWARENGYEIAGVSERAREGAWAVECTMFSVIDIDAIFEQTCELTVEAEKLGGAYDGWQTRVVESQAGN